MSSHIPAHVAVVMDGNGRWAKARFLPRVEGHRRGMAALKRLTEAARKAGIRHLTVFAFSSENWKRPADEVNALMRFFVDGLTREAGAFKRGRHQASCGGGYQGLFAGAAGSDPHRGTDD